MHYGQLENSECVLNVSSLWTLAFSPDSPPAPNSLGPILCEVTEQKENNCMLV